MRMLIIKTLKKDVGGCSYNTFLPLDMEVVDVNYNPKNDYLAIKCTGPRCPEVEQGALIPTVDLNDLKKWLMDETNYGDRSVFFNGGM